MKGSSSYLYMVYKVMFALAEFKLCQLSYRIPYDMASKLNFKLS